jgi:tRNA(Arg) A34 adenosine deaminase TadA
MNGEARLKFMSLAVEASRRAAAAGQAPFGACIVKDGAVVACEHNRVWADVDITAHAEIVAMREACRKLSTIDLSGCDIYSSTEPCPMCFSAIHWARIERIFYGASIEDARAQGFNELAISNHEMKSSGGATVEISGGIMRREAVAVFTVWASKGGAKTY